MAVSSTESSISHFGNNSTVTAYAVPFTFEAAADLVVTVIDDEGVRSTLALDSGYAVAGGNGENGSVTTMAPMPGTSTVLIERNTPPTNLTVWSDVATWRAETLQRNFDHLSRALIDVARRLEARFGGTVLSIGTVTHLPAGQTPTASISGTWPNFTLDLGLPTGATGGLDVGPDAMFGTTPNNQGGPALTLWDQGTQEFRAIVLINGELTPVSFP